LLNNSLSFHIGYWLKPLKEYRWNMIPEIGYSTSSREIENSTFNNTYTWTRFDLTVNNHIYFMDIESDCNCPTFSKDGNFLSKGFFLNIAPGVTMNNVDHTYAEGDEKNTLTGEGHLSFKLAVGAGFDIGIHDLVTITPFFNFTRILKSEINPLRINDQSDDTPLSSSINQREFGLRLNFRFDYVREQRGFRR